MFPEVILDLTLSPRSVLLIFWHIEVHFLAKNEKFKVKIIYFHFISRQSEHYNTGHRFLIFVSSFSSVSECHVYLYVNYIICSFSETLTFVALGQFFSNNRSVKGLFFIQFLVCFRSVFSVFGSVFIFGSTALVTALPMGF